MNTIVRSLHMNGMSNLKGCRSFCSSHFLRNSKKVRIFITPRDGYQDFKIKIPTKTKVDLYERIADLKTPHSEPLQIEMPSFGKLSQMGDSEQVLKKIVKIPGASPWTLVFNRWGTKKVIKYSGNIGFAGSVSEQFSLDNTERGIEEIFEKRHKPIMKLTVMHNIKTRFYASCFFGYQKQGDVNIEEALDISQRVYDLGIGVFVISDTTNFSTKKTLEEAVTKLLKRGFDKKNLAIHLHGPKDDVLEKILFCVNQLGIFEVDTSPEGLRGGCPAAKKEHSDKILDNPSTGSVVRLLEANGYDTGIVPAKLPDLEEFIRRNILSAYN